MTVSFQLDGRRLSLCFTSRWLARTLSPLPPPLSASRARLAVAACAASPAAGRLAPGAASALAKGVHKPSQRLCTQSASHTLKLLTVRLS